MPNIGGIYTGLTYEARSLSGGEEQQMDDLVNRLVSENKQDSIVSIFMLPSAFVPYNMEAATDPITLERSYDRPSNIDGYRPKNNKMFTYPYCFLTVDTLNDSHDYRFEYGTGGTLTFVMSCSISPNPEVLICPSDYNGFSGQNPTESVTCSGFPQCAYVIDSYRAWLAQSAAPEITSAIAAGVGTTASFATGNYLAGTIGLMGMASQVSNMVKEATQGSKARGVQGSSAAVGARLKSPYFKFMSVNAQFAEMIDSFFSRYGYATNRIKVPNRNVRPHWTYTKTRGCTMTGNMPGDVITKLKSIYDKGITFWRYGDEVGDYSLDNSPS